MLTYVQKKVKSYYKNEILDFKCNFTVRAPVHIICIVLIVLHVVNSFYPSVYITYICLYGSLYICMVPRAICSVLDIILYCINSNAVYSCNSVS